MKSLNNTFALSIIFAAILLLPLASNAANLPCSGSKGGIARCDGAQFVCNDGTISKSTKDCSAEFGNTSTTPSQTTHEAVKSIPNGNENTPAPSNAANGLPVTNIERTGNILKLGYQGFTVWLDCEKRGAVKFMYNAQHDTGNAKRADTFYLDPNVPPECQQTTAKAYGKKFDRGTSGASEPS